MFFTVDNDESYHSQVLLCENKYENQNNQILSVKGREARGCKLCTGSACATFLVFVYTRKIYDLCYNFVMG